MPVHHPTHASIPIHGMTCASCVNHVQRALQSLNGVSKVSVNFATETASVDFDAHTTTPQLLTQAVKEAGYEVPVQSHTLKIGGMTCASCVNHVEKALLKHPAILSAKVNLATETATVSTWASDLKYSTLEQTIRDAGYSIIAESDQEDFLRTSDSQSPELKSKLLLKQAVLSGTSGVFVMLVTMNLIPGFSSLTIGTRHTILFVITSFVLLWAGRPIYAAAWKAALHRSVNMNTLIAIGTLSAFGYSACATFFPSVFAVKGIPPAVYYDTAIIIIALILLGRYLENLAKNQTSSSIHKLMRLQPRTAKIRRGQKDEDILIEHVQPGDLLLVRPGEQIPVDGVVTEGRSSINEAMLTGESLPIEKEPGSKVLTGTLNISGSILFTASSVGENTVLARIVHLVQEAQGSKPPIQRFADYIASIFVPSVLGIATLAFFLWWSLGPEPALTYAILTFVAVLIIACPCALGLATPTAIMVGTGRGAEHGILIRHGEALEIAHQLDIIVLDKTGTLTQGIPIVTDIITHTCGENDLLRLAASLERHSEHPLAQAIVKRAQDQSLALEEAQNFENISGEGVKGSIDNQSVCIGNIRFITNHLGPTSFEHFSDAITRLAHKGKTPILIGINGHVEGVVGIADTIRPESKKAVQQLQKDGLEVVMLTGDHHQVAQAIAADLGITHFLADILPDQKAAEIQALQQNGRKRVAMVGDGINDAPALAQADVGIAIGTGTDIAMETAQITLMSGNLQGITKALHLSRATMRTIHQNLFWAFAYNIALIPLAAGILYPIFQWSGGVPNGLHWLFGDYGFLQPIMAAAAMACSSISVVTNSLRLKKMSLD
ncbi:MAG: heavy metal translocating P-type ATPase [Nitrospirota bacterium]|nr:heavy metal translocating P-type ATPase [Nitrospirota bacterium]